MGQATAAAFLALFARFSTCRFRRACAVTAQLTLNGRLFAVDSVEEKLQTAKEGGIKRVVVAMTNYLELPDKWKDDPDLEVKCASNVYELINHCLEDGQGGRPLVIFQYVCRSLYP
jgi:predicted ATP-dependent protease